MSRKQEASNERRRYIYEKFLTLSFYIWKISRVKVQGPQGSFIFHPNCLWDTHSGICMVDLTRQLLLFHRMKIFSFYYIMQFQSCKWWRNLTQSWNSSGCSEYSKKKLYVELLVLQVSHLSTSNFCLESLCYSPPEPSLPALLQLF